MQNLNPGVLISESFFPFPSSGVELYIFESQTCVTVPDCLCTSKEGISLLSVIAREGFRQKEDLLKSVVMSTQENERREDAVDGKSQELGDEEV